MTTKSSARHLAEIAMLVGALGGLLVAVGAVIGLGWLPGGANEGRAEHAAVLAGGVLLALGCLLFLLAIHNGFGSFKAASALAPLRVP